MDKAPDAFRTISEVADELETPAHVLRFWESRFPQIKPVKRAGGRRYYRPADVALLAGIRQLLHTDGMTIRGVQKVLREQGVRHVASLGGADVAAFDMDADLESPVPPAPTMPPPPLSEKPAMGRVLHLDRLPRRPVGAPAFGQEAPHKPLLPGVESNQIAARATDGTSTSGPVELRDGEGGFLPFPTRRVRPKPAEAEPPAQARLPFDNEEAPHIWAAEDADLDAMIHALPSVSVEEVAAGMLSEDFGTAQADDARDDRSPAMPVEGLVAGILAEEFGAAMMDEVSKAIEEAIAAPTGSDHRDTGSSELDLTETDLTEAGPTEPAMISATDQASDPLHDPHADLSRDYGTASHPDALPWAQSGPLLPDLTGLAARLRALSAPLAPQKRDELAELHSRLGLLHAQMVEAVRLRH